MMTACRYAISSKIGNSLGSQTIRLICPAAAAMNTINDHSTIQPDNGPEIMLYLAGLSGCSVSFISILLFSLAPSSEGAQHGKSLIRDGFVAQATHGQNAEVGAIGEFLTQAGDVHVGDAQIVVRVLPPEFVHELAA